MGDTAEDPRIAADKYMQRYKIMKLLEVSKLPPHAADGKRLWAHLRLSGNGDVAHLRTPGRPKHSPQTLHRLLKN
jgi:hypothetical protein